jgi:hypothetical protein
MLLYIVISEKVVAPPQLFPHSGCRSSACHSDRLTTCPVRAAGFGCGRFAMVVLAPVLAKASGYFCSLEQVITEVLERPAPDIA